jgi:hypothetical protein
MCGRFVAIGANSLSISRELLTYSHLKYLDELSFKQQTL